MFPRCGALIRIPVCDCVRTLVMQHYSHVLVPESAAPEAHLTVFGMLMLHAVYSACWRACLATSLQWTWVLWSNLTVKTLPL